jgi:hypothetical protein
MKILEDPEYKRLIALRQDAIDRDLTDLALAYGWSAIDRADTLIRERFGGQFSYAPFCAALRRLVDAAS